MYSRIYLRLEPLGLELVAAAARNAGHGVELIDLQSETHDDYFRRLERFRPHVVAFSGNYLANVPEIVDLAKATRARLPETAIVVGGHSVSFTANEVLEHADGAVDCVLRGEGEASFPQLLDAIEHDKAAMHRVPGAVTRDGTGSTITWRSGATTMRRTLSSFRSTSLTPIAPTRSPIAIARRAVMSRSAAFMTSLPDEAAIHADTIFLGPGEETFPGFLKDLRNGAPKRRYASTAGGTIDALSPIRRDLIKRDRYLVPNSIVVTRGCPQHCDFCYKDAFFAGGRSYYTQRVDAALAEIDRLPGRHLYFLDDHLLGDRRFAEGLFAGMRGLKGFFVGCVK